MSADENKAPGPDGFPFKFAQMFLLEFKEEIISIFDHFYETTEFDHRSSSSFIYLIPKAQNPSGNIDFRPI